LHTADSQHGQYRHRDHDDADAPHPLQQLAIDKDRSGQIVQPHNHRGTGSGQPRDGFEYGLGGRQIQGFGEGEGQRPEQPQNGPEQGGNEETVADTQIVAYVSHRQPHQHTGKKGDTQGGQEARDGGIIRQQSHHQRRQHGAAEKHQQDTQDSQ
jgi:hypothetical protein